jgi:hypothetical protein
VKLYLDSATRSVEFLPLGGHHSSLSRDAGMKPQSKGRIVTGLSLSSSVDASRYQDWVSGASSAAFSGVLSWVLANRPVA